MNTQFDLQNTSIVIGEKCFSFLCDFLIKNKPSKVFIIVDNNTKKYCLPILLRNIPILLNSKIIFSKIGEDAKSLNSFEDTCLQLTNNYIDRKSLIINLGGGVICDLGGFVSFVLKRGVKFINMPTTLMSQVDAAIGGKVGLNLSNYKNQIGTFYNPISVLIYSPYLSSLPKNELLSAQAEIFKYALIYDKNFWSDLCATGSLEKSNYDNIIAKCVSIKIHIISSDYYDWSERRKLNFGHSIAHAIESLFIKKQHPIAHGYALAVGLICETYISYIKYGFSKKNLNSVVNNILAIFPAIHIDHKQYDLLIHYMKLDKKNAHGSLNFTLIKDIGHALVNCPVSQKEIISALNFYREQCQK
tara:strand:+ start:1883 stop:2959 length:1077 start_codon:yes stop_codon:yes gene_type:complete